MARDGLGPPGSQPFMLLGKDMRDYPHLRQVCIVGLSLILLYEFIIFTSWMVVATLFWKLEAIPVWVMMSPFLLRMLLLATSIGTIKHPYLIDTHRMGVSANTAKKHALLRSTSIITNPPSMCYYGWIVKYFHPVLITFVIAFEGILLGLTGSGFIFVVNVVVGLLVAMTGWVFYQTWRTYCIHIPRDKVFRESTDYYGV